jgi:hypothetical protein
MQLGMSVAVMSCRQMASSAHSGRACLQAYLDLHSAMMARGHDEMRRCVTSDHERRAAAGVLAQTSALMSQLGHAAGAAGSLKREDQEQMCLFSQVADTLLRWLAAGPPGDCSLCDDPGMQSALAVLPGSLVEEHHLITISQGTHAR